MQIGVGLPIREPHIDGEFLTQWARRADAAAFDGAYDEAQPWIEKAIAAARQAGARRYVAVDCMLLSICRREQGRLAQARELLAEAFELARQLGMAFFGPSLLAAVLVLAVLMPLFGATLLMILAVERFALRRMPGTRAWLGLKPA